MEDAKPAEATEVAVDFGKPYFLEQLSGPVEPLKEAQTVHFQCQAMPNNDPKLKVEWFFNGQLLAHASRFKIVNDFGFLTLDLLYVYPEDTGTYSVKISNAGGEATTSFNIECKGEPYLSTSGFSETRVFVNFLKQT